MSKGKAILPVLMAAILAATAGPGLAKQQGSGEVTTTQQQQGGKKATRQAGKDCFFTAPPFMRNPRFMNRGFFKKKCPGQDP